MTDKIISDQQTAYVLKVTLLDTDPVIWRRVRVPGSINLGALHDVLQIAMGWSGDHLHQFKARGTYYGPCDEDLEVEEEQEAQLCAVLPSVKSKMVYEYDFGDSWLHDIVVEEIGPGEAAHSRPECLDGQRACPPEDCGGTEAYAEILDALDDPEHGDEDLLDMVGDSFDPASFDRSAVNALLKDVGSPH